MSKNVPQVVDYSQTIYKFCELLIVIEIYMKQGARSQIDF